MTIPNYDQEIERRGHPENFEPDQKECHICLGYGLWVIGEPTPMGERDSHAMPSKPCPECGKGGTTK